MSESPVDRAVDQSPTGAEDLRFQGQPDPVDQVGLQEKPVDGGPAQKHDLRVTSGAQLAHDLRRWARIKLEQIGSMVGLRA